MPKEEVLRMVTVDEMKKFLLDEFGIKSEVELESALKKQGGIKIAIFTDEPSADKRKSKASLA